PFRFSRSRAQRCIASHPENRKNSLWPSRFVILNYLLMNAELIVVNGADAGSRYALDREEFFIGRAPNSSLVLSEPDVSWRHCQIRRQSFKYLVTDLRTSAGTYVN